MIAANKRHEALDTLYRANQVRGDTSIHTPVLSLKRCSTSSPRHSGRTPTPRFLILRAAEAHSSSRSTRGYSMASRL